jgi:hypothetical protein
MPWSSGQSHHRQPDTTLAEQQRPQLVPAALIVWLPVTENTFIISNCRTTAVP